MAELTPKERLQPSLLDRLTDENPEKLLESRDQRVMSIKKLRDAVLRDLAWLLNASSLSVTENLDEYPLVAHSVLNYGAPDFAGRTASGVDAADLESRLRQCVQDFEPRIQPGSLRVRVVTSEEQMNRNALTFEIEGDLWAQPLPEHLYLKTQIDLETGDVTIEDRFGQRSR